MLGNPTFLVVAAQRHVCVSGASLIIIKAKSNAKVRLCFVKLAYEQGFEEILMETRKL